MKLRYLPIIAAMGFLASSCATQTASRGSSTDDIYFSTEDAQASTITTETTTTTNTSDTYTTYPGNSEKVDYNQPSGSDADYRTGSEDLSSETYYDDEGNTYVVNNYYEDDNYGYDDYDDYYYTTNIYRYYYPYSGFGYYSHCYSPYYYNPYGWNISFGWGYGSCYPYGYYGYYDPWYSPYYGYGYGYGGYGNGYYNGYYDGYYNGYYDGYYGSGYGNDGYYGYSDNGYYYGPNTSTGSNTNTGSSSVDMIAAGYDKTGNQYVDTPGLLDRPIEKRNPIERQAILALKHLAKLILFVIDPTEHCGYPIKDQEHLLKEIRNMFKLPIIIVANKADEGKEYKNAMAVSAKKGIGIDELKEKINEIIKS